MSRGLVRQSYTRYNLPILLLEVENMKYKFITKLYLTVEANSEDEAFDKILDWDIENPEEIEIEDRETEVDPA